MDSLAFDPIDLAILTAAWEGGRAANNRNSFELSITRAETLVETAEILHRLWLEVDVDKWSGVFAYDVADPLGNRMGDYFAENDAMPDASEIEKWALELIAANCS
jgi:hypothetical protein